MDILKHHLGNQHTDHQKDVSPLPGHWMRFRVKYVVSQYRKKPISLHYVGTSAAAAFFLVVSMLPFLHESPDIEVITQQDQPVVIFYPECILAAVPQNTVLLAPDFIYHPYIQNF